MSIKVSGKDLAAVISRAVKDTHWQSDVCISVLRGLLFDVEGSKFTITATDLRTMAKYVVDGKASGRRGWSAVLADPRQILKWLKAGKGNGESIQISFQKSEEENGRDKIIFERSGRRVTMLAFPASEFPATDIFRKRRKRAGAMKAGDIQRWGVYLGATASDDETRNYLNSVHLKDGYLSSSDGHRLNHLDMSKDLSTEAEIAIPKTAWNRFVQDCKTIKDPECEIAFCTTGKIRSDQYLRVVYGNCTRMIKDCGAERFPVDHIIPKFEEAVFQPEKGEMFDVLKEAKSVITTSHRAVYLVPSERGYKIFHNNPEGIMFEAPLPGEVVGDNPPEIGFNIWYLLDALEPFENPVMHLGGQIDGVLIDEPGNPMIHVLMPIRV